MTIPKTTPDCMAFVKVITVFYNDQHQTIDIFSRCEHDHVHTDQFTDDHLRDSPALQKMLDTLAKKPYIQLRQKD